MSEEQNIELFHQYIFSIILHEIENQNKYKIYYFIMYICINICKLFSEALINFLPGIIYIQFL